MRYSTLIKQLFIIAKSKWAIQLLKGKIFSIASFEAITNLKRMVPEINCIIDVGANSGQFSKVATHFYPDATINAFEPLPNLYPALQNLFKNNKKITTHNLALGNENGEIKFNKNKYGHISSILDISSENIHYPKQHNDLDQITVAIQTLDNAIANQNTTGTGLLKLDVQGYEMEVLKGASQTIKKIDYIIIEANLEQLYANQPSFTQMNNFLLENGFEVKGMLNFNLGHQNKYIEVDLLYKKLAAKN